jgi:hypothetical protein
MRRTRLLLTAHLAACLALAGCIVSVEKTVEEGRALPDPAVVASLAEGQTTRAELVAMLGTPTSATETADAGELLVYEYRSRQDTRTSVLLLLNWASQVTRVVRHKFALRDGVVVRHWTEHVP